jgi:cytochrome c556
VKKVTLLIAGIFCSIGFAGLTNSIYPRTVSAAEEAGVSHEGVVLPTRVLMSSIARRMSNILEGTLAGNLKYVAQEAGSIVDESYKINEVFFPIDPKENKWFQRAKIDPNDSERIAKLKEGFHVYMKSITSSALEVQKAAKADNQKATFKAFTNMVEKTCFECHAEIRDKMIPVENR